MDNTRERIDAMIEELDITCQERNAAIAERDALRRALVSLLEGQDERDIEHFTRLTVDEARRIMDLAYNRK